MAFNFVLSSAESSVFEVSAPSYQDIRNALTNVQVPSASWVGPGPRVTRRTAVGDFLGFITTVVAVIAVEAADAAQAQSIASQAAQQADSALDAIGSWTPIVPQPYNEVINGPLSWWQSGQATQAHTRDEFLTGISRLDAYDNAMGPDSLAVRPSTPGEIVRGIISAPSQAIQQTSQQATNLLTIGAIVVGSSVALYLLWPLLTRARETSKANPIQLTSDQQEIVRIATAIDLSGKYLGALNGCVKKARENIRGVVYSGSKFEPSIYHRLGSELRRKINRTAHAQPHRDLRQAREASEFLKSV